MLGAADRDVGLTLVEVVVALALFALVGAAGAGLLTTVTDADRHTAGRLDRLADIERAMAVVARDLTEIADAPLTGTAAGVAFARHGGSRDTGKTVAMAYRLAGGRLERVAGGPQRLLDGVTRVRWRYYDAAVGWQDRWPAGPSQALGWPAAVALDLDLAGPPPAGHLRRIVDLPVRPQAVPP